MSDFSIGDAVGSGFGLIAKRPVAVVVWGIVYVLVALAPAVLVGAWILADVPSLIQAANHAAAQGAEAGPPAAFFALQGKMMVLQPIVLLTSLAARGFLAGAVFRGVLEPDNRKFLSMRFGKQELWLAVLFLVFGIVLGFAIFGVVLIAVMLGGLAWLLGSLAPHPWSGWITALLIVIDVIAAVVACFWVGLRLSLAPVITFVDKEFRLFESWTVTRGHAWKLFGLALVLCAISMAIGGVVYGFLFAGIFSMFGGFDPGHIRAFIEQVEASPQVLVQALAPRIGIFCVLALLLSGPLAAIFVAPWASAYRQLVRDRKPEHPPVF